MVAKQIKEDLASGDRSDAAAVPGAATSIVTITKAIYDTASGSSVVIGARSDAAAVPTNTTSVISIIKKIYDTASGSSVVIGARSDAAAVPTNTTSVISIIKKIYDVVASLTAYFLTLTETGATRTTDGTEQNVYIHNAPAGVFTPKMLNIDFTNQTATETVVLREYYRIKSGGAYVLQDEATFIGVQDPELIHITLKDNRFGVKVTIEKIAGTNRAYDYEVVYEI